MGSGDKAIEENITRLAKKYPRSVAAIIAYDEGLSRRIYAGCDFLIMPSRFEPCGLNQLYSMAYGTVPVVRKTGGLADTVVDASLETLDNGTANGFSFTDFTAEALDHCLHRATRMYYEDKENWRQLVNQGMGQDWSWTASAKAYEALYSKLVKS